MYNKSCCILNSTEVKMVCFKWRQQLVLISASTLGPVVPLVTAGFPSNCNAIKDVNKLLTNVSGSFYV